MYHCTMRTPHINFMFLSLAGCSYVLLMSSTFGLLLLVPTAHVSSIAEGQETN